MDSDIEKISVYGDSYAYTKTFDTPPLRNITTIRVEYFNLPPRTSEIYVLLSFPDLNVEFPVLYNDRYSTLYDGQMYPLQITDAHYHDFDCPLASLNRLRVHIKDPDGNVLVPESGIPASFFLMVSIFYDNRLELIPEMPKMKDHRILRLFDFSFSETDESRYSFLFDFSGAATNAKLQRAGSLKNVTKVRLRALHVPPSSVDPVVFFEIPELGLRVPVHYNYWNAPSDVVLLRTTDYHSVRLLPPKNIEKWTVRVSKADGSVLTKADTNHIFGMYALLEIEYRPRSFLD
jgi:hypothetical protein